MENRIGDVENGIGDMENRIEDVENGIGDEEVSILYKFPAVDESSSLCNTEVIVVHGTAVAAVERLVPQNCFDSYVESAGGPRCCTVLSLGKGSQTCDMVTCH